MAGTRNLVDMIFFNSRSLKLMWNNGFTGKFRHVSAVLLNVFKIAFS